MKLDNRLLIRISNIDLTKLKSLAKHLGVATSSIVRESIKNINYFLLHHPQSNTFINQLIIIQKLYSTINAIGISAHNINSQVIQNKIISCISRNIEALERVENVLRNVYDAELALIFIKQCYIKHNKKIMPPNNMIGTLKVIDQYKKTTLFIVLCKYIITNSKPKYLFDYKFKRNSTKDILKIYKDFNFTKNNKHNSFIQIIYALPSHIKLSTKMFNLTIHKSCQEAFLGHKYIFGIHRNTDNLHVHILVKKHNQLLNTTVKLNKKTILRVRSIFNMLLTTVMDLSK